MDELRKRAKELLESNAVQLIIGYEQGSNKKTRAVFIEKPDDASKLIFDSRCVQNLAVYLTKTEVKKKGKTGIVAPVPVLRSILQLAAENQVADDSIVILGITPDSKLIEFTKINDVEQFVEQFTIDIEVRDKEILAKLNNMTAEERWKFWINELSPCFKCYACRAACPLCYCTRCTVDDNKPQWIPVASNQLGNLEWHIMRAMHMAGRCTDCGACADACPIAIPLNLLTKKMREDMKDCFGDVKPSVKSGNLMSTFKPDDKENFIR